MIYLITFGIFLILILFMTIGVIAKRKPIQGSCGGLANVGAEKVCNCETTCDEHQKQLYQIQEPETKQDNH
ncbi:hypothetical protein VA7868_01279 [Vibrio aerogenes CECT 7868]|uniref:(Na+)-NQR maturation NqrM n=1 Tax=Vibrio aerogenes CECT 7868 TaxID=1216006 RepID=A0A1M5XRT9_9VIBR|nr:(Na+)-NQR maturation NqrM [Vibrio aerogenes]SHI02500.1 hypothetical protein VA7868_01279 [Vibrio aerogenes CECT 7868]